MLEAVRACLAPWLTRALSSESVAVCSTWYIAVAALAQTGGSSGRTDTARNGERPMSVRFLRVSDRAQAGSQRQPLLSVQMMGSPLPATPLMP
jgi:hypothetical protein